jgi:hypothetical protein
MAISVFLGGFGFGNLGDEACLATAYDLYKGEINCTFTHDQVITSKVAKFDFYFSDLRALLDRYPRIDRVVIAGGGVGFMPSFRDNLDWALHCKQRGAEVIVHNIGIGKIGPDWAINWPYLVPVLSEAKEFSVRDYRSKAEVESWGLDLHPEVSFYPERNHPANDKLRDLLPADAKFIGISINNRPELWRVLHDNVDSMRNVVARFDDCLIIPIVSTIHSLDQAEHDNVGFEKFIDLLGLGNRVVLRQLCDYEFWRNNVGPADIKFLISCCQLLISARKHNIIHAIGAGVPFVGVFEFDNDSIPRVYQTLYPVVPSGSSLFPIYPL